MITLTASYARGAPAITVPATSRAGWVGHVKKTGKLIVNSCMYVNGWSPNCYDVSWRQSVHVEERVTNYLGWRPAEHVAIQKYCTSCPVGLRYVVHGRGCNLHRSLWRHWWRHNSETITDREKRRSPRPMKSSELSNGETHRSTTTSAKPEMTSFMTS